MGAAGVGSVFPLRDQGKGEGEGTVFALTVSSPIPPPPAQWRTPFDPKQTYKSQFHVSKNKTVEVPMMSIGDLVTPYFRDEELDCTLVELTCTSNDSALFILPDEGKMQDLEAKLIPEMMTRWRESLYPS